MVKWILPEENRKLWIKYYILNILVSIDQFVNTLFGGSPDETISSRLARNYPNSIMRKFVDILFFFEENHCQKYLEMDNREKDAIIGKRKSNKKSKIDL